VASKQTVKLLCVLCALFLFSGSTSTQQGPGDVNSKKSLLIGTWIQGGLSYTFEDTSMLSVIGPSGGLAESIRTPYRWMKLGVHDCIVFQSNPPDSLSLQVVLVGEVGETEAVLALGVPFAREGKGTGLLGTWCHAERQTCMRWTIGPEDALYSESVCDIAEGSEKMIERHRGKWLNAPEYAEPGSFILDFGKIGQATVLPVVYLDMMYLFDLSKGKSLFTRMKHTADMTVSIKK
jgi:hypothetical protein